MIKLDENSNKDFTSIWNKQQELQLLVKKKDNQILQLEDKVTRCSAMMNQKNIKINQLENQLRPLQEKYDDLANNIRAKNLVQDLVPKAHALPREQSPFYKNKRNRSNDQAASPLNSTGLSSMSHGRSLPSIAYQGQVPNRFLKVQLPQIDAIPSYPSNVNSWTRPKSKLSDIRSIPMRKNSTNQSRNSKLSSKNLQYQTTPSRSRPT